VKIHIDLSCECSKKLDKLLRQQEVLMAAFEDLTAKITNIQTSLDGVTDDIANLKALVEANPNGLNAAQAAELLNMLTAVETRVADIDASTT
jgi:hypothetical protein